LVHIVTTDVSGVCTDDTETFHRLWEHRLKGPENIWTEATENGEYNMIRTFQRISL